MTGDRTLFDQYWTVSNVSDVITASGSRLKTVGRGFVSIPGKDIVLPLAGVHHVEGLGFNLISVSALARDGYSVLFSGVHCVIRNREGRVVLTARCSGSLYRVGGTSVAAVSVRNDWFRTWHRRFGHTCGHYVSRMLGVPRESSSRKCTVCSTCKVKRKTYSGPSHCPGETLGQVDCDLCGPYPTPTPSGSRYFGIAVDRFSRFTAIFFLRQKSDFRDTFAEWLDFIKARFGRYPKVVHSDGGGEFISGDMDIILHDRGIYQSSTCPDTPTQNAYAERMIGKVQRMSDCMMEESGAPRSFWGEAAAYSVWLLNRLPHRSLGYKTPQAVFEGVSDPVDSLGDVRYARVFGCAAYVRLVDTVKGQVKGARCVMVGRDRMKKGYRLWVPSLGRIVISADVVFDEETFPFRDTDRGKQGENVSEILGRHFRSDESVDSPHPHQQSPPDRSAPPRVENNPGGVGVSVGGGDSLPARSSGADGEVVDLSSSVPSDSGVASSSPDYSGSPSPAPVRRSTRQRKQTGASDTPLYPTVTSDRRSMGLSVMFTNLAETLRGVCGNMPKSYIQSQSRSDAKHWHESGQRCRYI